MQALLDDLCQGPGAHFALAAVAVSHGGKDRIWLATDPIARNATRSTRFRVASISKLVTARAISLTMERAGLSLDTLAGDILGWPLVHPSGVPVRVSQLLAHHGGLADIGRFLETPDRALSDWMRQPEAWIAPPPGSFFLYSNMGYVLLAEIAAILANTRFDRLAQEAVLAPLGIAGGFNWSGVTDRSDRLPTWRWEDDGFRPQIDAVVCPQGVSGPDGAQITAPTTARLSPQGGLRLSIAEMLSLARTLPDPPPPALWTCDRPGDYGGGVFEDYGAGMQIFKRADWFAGHSLHGHFGNAYGFAGGVWRVPGRDFAFAYALNGVPDSHDNAAREVFFHPAELTIFNAVARVLN